MLCLWPLKWMSCNLFSLWYLHNILHGIAVSSESHKSVTKDHFNDPKTDKTDSLVRWIRLILKQGQRENPSSSAVFNFSRRSKNIGFTFISLRPWSFLSLKIPFSFFGGCATTFWEVKPLRSIIAVVTLLGWIAKHHFLLDMNYNLSMMTWCTTI